MHLPLLRCLRDSNELAREIILTSHSLINKTQHTQQECVQLFKCNSKLITEQKWYIRFAYMKLVAVSFRWNLCKLQYIFFECCFHNLCINILKICILCYKNFNGTQFLKILNMRIWKKITFRKIAVIKEVYTLKIVYHVLLVDLTCKFQNF